MAKDPAFLLYYKDILVSCAGWDADELGWYLRLLCHQADKPDGLPPDVEELATLANVKFSQYDRFKQAWKGRLKQKFEANEQGLLINSVQQFNLKKRQEYKSTQAKRGLVGYYIKKARREQSMDSEKIRELSEILFSTLQTENSKEQNEQAYSEALSQCLSKPLSQPSKHTPPAYIGNVNAIGNANGILTKSKEEGVGGETERLAEFPVSQMAAAWMTFFPSYPFSQSSDFPPLAELITKICDWKGLDKNTLDRSSPKITEVWREVIRHIASDSFLQRYSISQVAKHFQSIIQSLNANASGKTGETRKDGTNRAVITGHAEGFGAI